MCRDPRNHAWGEDLAGAQRCSVLSHFGEQGKISRCGPRLPAFLEAQLLDGFIGDGSRNAYAAFVFDGHMAVNGAFVFGGHMTISGAFISMRKGEPAFFWGFVIAPIEMDALGRPFRALCKMCGNAAMKSYSILP